MIKTVADLKKELHKAGIKTYMKKATGKSYVKRTDVKKVLASPTGDQFDEAIEILENDSELKDLINQMKHNSNKYFDTYYKLSDEEVKKGEDIEKGLGDKYDARAKELGLEKSQNGMWYKS